MKMGIV